MPQTTAIDADEPAAKINIFIISYDKNALFLKLQLINLALDEAKILKFGTSPIYKMSQQ